MWPGKPEYWRGGPLPTPTEAETPFFPLPLLPWLPLNSVLYGPSILPTPLTGSVRFPMWEETPIDLPIMGVGVGSEGELPLGEGRLTV